MPNKRMPVSPPKNRSLFVIAGLAKEVSNTVVNRLKKDGGIPPASFVAIPSGRDPFHLYKPATIRTLIRATGGFVLTRRKRAREEDPIVPNRVFLLFVPTPDAEELLLAFDFICFPTPLNPQFDWQSPGEWNQFAWRNNAEIATQVVRDVIVTISRGESAFLFLQAELGSGNGKSSFLLPPKNFRISSQGYSIEQWFRDFRSGRMRWEEIRENLAPRRFLREQLPKAAGSKPKAWFFVDDRGIVFPPSLHQHLQEQAGHGQVRQLPSDADAESIKKALQSLYRFGVALRPGFQHDAQREGQSLKNESLFCSEKGPVLVSGTHANIFPNDRVTAKNVVPVERQKSKAQ